MVYRKNIKPLPFPVYFWTVFICALAGLINSIYLSISHYRIHTDILYTSFCAVSKSINCDTVSQSPYSIFLNVPIPVWGILGYLFFLLILFGDYARNTEEKRMWSLLVSITFGFSLYSLVLAYISKYYIGAFCIMCIVSYGINFVLLFFSWLIRRRFSKISFLNDLKKDVLFICEYWKNFAIRLTPLLIILFMLPFALPEYWTFTLPTLSSDMSTGKTEEGCPWIGAQNPELVITEYADYMCFHCKKTHAYLRQIVQENPKRIRLVHRHFPMDKNFNPLVTGSFHSGAAKLAIAAAYAALEGKFWRMNDLLYDIPKGTKKLDIQELARKTGVNVRGLAVAPRNKAIRYKVKHDVAKGIKLGITGTPAYVIDGNVYQGRIPVKVIKKALD